MNKKIECFIATNRFINCSTLLSYHSHPIINFADSPDEITLDTTPFLNQLSNTVTNIKMEKCKITTYSDPFKRSREIIRHNSGLILYIAQFNILTITFFANFSTLQIDLRPIGINFYSDNKDLNMAGRNMMGNQVNGTKTIFSI